MTKLEAALGSSKTKSQTLEFKVKELETKNKELETKKKSLESKTAQVQETKEAEAKNQRIIDLLKWSAISLGGATLDEAKILEMKYPLVPFVEDQQPVSMQEVRLYVLDILSVVDPAA